MAAKAGKGEAISDFIRNKAKIPIIPKIARDLKDLLMGFDMTAP